MARHLELELEKIRREVLSLAAYVEDIVVQSVISLETRDTEKAVKIVSMDQYVNEKEVDIEEACLKVLALHQPVAHDLRFLIGVIKVNNDLERIADLAVNVAKRTIYIAKEERVMLPFDLNAMSNEAVRMMRNTMKALFATDVVLARQIIKEDHIIDEMNRHMYQAIFLAIKEDPNRVAVYINYFSAGRMLERIADYCTNISEDLIYMKEGTIVRHNPSIAGFNNK